MSLPKFCTSGDATRPTAYLTKYGTKRITDGGRRILANGTSAQRTGPDRVFACQHGGLGVQSLIRGMPRCRYASFLQKLVVPYQQRDAALVARGCWGYAQNPYLATYTSIVRKRNFRRHIQHHFQIFSGVQHHIGIEKHAARTEVLGKRKTLFAGTANCDGAMKIEALGGTAFNPVLCSGHHLLHVQWN